MQKGESNMEVPVNFFRIINDDMVKQVFICSTADTAVELQDLFDRKDPSGQRVAIAQVGPGTICSYWEMFAERFPALAIFVCGANDFRDMQTAHRIFSVFKAIQDETDPRFFEEVRFLNFNTRPDKTPAPAGYSVVDYYKEKME